MRAALNDCKEQIDRLHALLQLSSTSLRELDAAQVVQHFLSLKNKGCMDVQQLFHSAWVSSNSLEQEREFGLQRVHEGLSCSSDDGNDDNHGPIDVLYVDENGWYRENNGVSNVLLAPSKFKQEYCFRNVPCIIRGFDELNFKDVSLNWKKSDRTTDDATTNESSTINTSWFEAHIGEDTMVPVRIDGTINGLDEDGRAEECTTKMLSLKDWITTCQEVEHSNHGEEYLKDWHLLQLLRSKQPVDDDTAPSPLYKTPQYFERDILNNFLERYNGGDYKFVYWGPRGSMTRLHSDVLHSFSWSYNVSGEKKWTFYIPNSYSDNSNNTGANSSRSFEVIQHTGDTIFVPSTWKHEVINLVETLSINHNWITSANIDKTWQCICSEIKAIECEIKEWGVVPLDDFEARENMLRGCIGLDVTTFFLMLVLEVSELLVLVLSSVDDIIEDDDAMHDAVRSIYNLVSVLGCPEAKSAERLQTALGSKTEAIQAQEYATFVTHLTDILKEPLG